MLRFYPLSYGFLALILQDFIFFFWFLGIGSFFTFFSRFVTLSHYSQFTNYIIGAVNIKRSFCRRTTDFEFLKVSSASFGTNRRTYLFYFVSNAFHDFENNCFRKKIVKICFFSIWSTFYHFSLMRRPRTHSWHSRKFLAFAQLDIF